MADYNGMKKLAKELGVKDYVGKKAEKLMDMILDFIEEKMDQEGWPEENQEAMAFYNENTESEGAEEEEDLDEVAEAEEAETEDEEEEEEEEDLDEVEEKVKTAKAEKEKQKKEKAKNKVAKTKNVKSTKKKDIELDEFGFPVGSNPSKFAAAIKKKPMKMGEVKKEKWNSTGATFYAPWKKLVATGIGVKTEDGKLTIKEK